MDVVECMAHDGVVVMGWMVCLMMVGSQMKISNKGN